MSNDFIYPKNLANTFVVFEKIKGLQALIAPAVSLRDSLGLTAHEALGLKQYFEKNAALRHSRELEAIYKNSALEQLRAINAGNPALNELRTYWEQTSKPALSLVENTALAQVRKLKDLIGATWPLADQELHADTNALSAARILEALGARGEFNDVWSYLSGSALNPPGEATGDEYVAQHEHSAHEVREDNEDVAFHYADAAAQRPITNEDFQSALRQILDAIKASNDSTKAKMIWLILIPFLLMALNWVVGPVADVYMKRLVEGPKPGATADVRQAAADAVKDLGLLVHYRFVTAKKLDVRAHPNARAKVVGQLEFSDCARVVQSEGDFTLVEWKSADGAAEIQGWVFSRYLKKFAK
jgi:hypothetical protein